MKSFVICLGLLGGSAAMVGCATAPQTEARRDTLQDRSIAVLDRFKTEDPTVDPFLSHAAGYAIFPSVGKGAAVVGGAYGRGVLYQHGQMVGYCDMTQASVGPQLGGQKYSELIVFETPDALNRFKQNDVTFAANASAIALKSGGAASAKYENGVAVFTRADTGLMAEAAIGGQRFSYRTTDQVDRDRSVDQERMNDDGTARIE